MSQQAFTQADFGAVASQRGWVQAQVPELKPWPDLLLVDLPGWASGQTQDENLLDAYLHSLLRTHLEHQILYVLVVAADEGTLRSAMLQQLRRLELGHSPHLLVLSKCVKQLGLSPPQPHTSSAGIQKLARDFKSLINTAVEKSEPGWLSSSDPEDVGKRLMRNVRSQRDKFRACICSYAGSDLHECFEQHSQA